MGPNLSHTGIKCAFSSSDKDLLRPDGSISTELRSSVNAGVRNLPMLYNKDVTQRTDFQKTRPEDGSIAYSGQEESGMDLLGAPYSSRSIRSAYSTSDFFEGSPAGFSTYDMNSSGIEDSLDRLVVTKRKPKPKKGVHTGPSDKPPAIYTYRSAIEAMVKQV